MTDRLKLGFFLGNKLFLLEQFGNEWQKAYKIKNYMLIDLTKTKQINCYLLP